MAQTKTPGSRFTVDLPGTEYADLKRRATDEGLPMTLHVRRLIRQDAAAHPVAPADIAQAA